MSSDPSDPRIAARLAAEARLRGDPAPGSPAAVSKNVAIKPWIPPTEQEDTKSKKEFYKLLDRGIVRDNGYRLAAECCETLLKISSNIIANPDEPKFRTLKATNKLIKEKILAAKGGHEYLIALGFRTITVDFSQHYVIESTPKRNHLLKLGNEVLNDRLPALTARLMHIHESTSQTKKQEEAERAAAAIRNAEADRQIVKERVEREKLAREARLRRQREEEAAQHEAGASAHGQQHVHYHGEEEEDENQGGGDDDQDGDDNGEEEDEEGGQSGRQNDSGLNGGYRLGGA